MKNLEELEKNAIDAAISANWDEAIKLNEEIIRHDKNNIEAYLRLGFAYFQKGDIKNAKKIYLKAKKLQQENYLIEKNLEKITVLEKKKNRPSSTTTLSPYTFLDIPGKTKSISLVNCGQKSTLAALSIGQEVFLVPKKRKLEVRTKNKEYIGSLPDDLSKRLTIFMKAGSSFCCYIKESDLKNVTVFIKEEKRGKRVLRYAPFPINNNITANINLNNEEKENNDSEEISDNDLEKLAESLINEDKEEFISFQSNLEDDQEESEE